MSRIISSQNHDFDCSFSMILVILSMSLFVTEIFHSIQGESILSGRPCVFVRLSGCNLRCSFCDTQYAYENGPQMTISQIIEKTEHYKCKLVEITGGEPLIQKDTPTLVQHLVDKNFEVMLETNGTIDTGSIHKNCMKIIDIKCPSSGESRKNNFVNFKRLTPKDQIKFIIATREDYEYANHILQTYSPELPDGHVLYSPVFGKLDTSILAEWIVEDGLNVRLQLQIHKYIWPEKERGI